MVDRDEFSSVREGSLDLDVVDHVCDAIHDVFAFQNGCSVAHEIRNRPAVARPFKDFVGEDRDRLRIIEFKTSRLAPPGEICRDNDEKLFLFAR